MSFLDFDLYIVPEGEAIRERCFGGGGRGVFVVLSVQPDLRETMEAFVAKVFTAAGIDLSKDTWMLYLKPEEQFNLAALCRQMPVSKVIAFGIPAARMGVQALAKAYQPAVVEDLELLLAHDITAIYDERQQGGKQLSGALWNGLKVMFKL